MIAGLAKQVDEGDYNSCCYIVVECALRLAEIFFLFAVCRVALGR